MRILNATRGTVLAERGWAARKPFERMKGLLGRDGLDPEQGLLIDPCNSIHTFFMRFPIDVLFVDKAGVVVRAFEALPAWRTTRIYGRARSVVELPAGTLSRTGTWEGDRLAFEDEPEAAATAAAPTPHEGERHG